MRDTRGASLKLSLAALLTAMGVAVAPLLHFPLLAFKAYPGQHAVNAVAGVLLGPWWAAGIAVAVGVIRMGMGVGTIYSMPGGIPGALVVGLACSLLRRAGFKRPEVAALLEPLGTVLIGGTLAVYVVAPLAGHERMVGALAAVWAAWAASSIPGALLGFAVLSALRRVGVLEAVGA